MANNIQLVVTQDKDLNSFQTQLQTSMQPILANPINYGVQLKSVSLINGQTTVPTTINRALQGWFLTRIRAQATIWDSQDTNTNPNQSLILNSNAAVVVDLWVY